MSRRLLINKRRSLWLLAGVLSFVSAAAVSLEPWTPAEAAVSSANPGEQFVSVLGDDINDGYSPATANRTVAGAVADLPTYGTGNRLRHEGTIHIGSGLFLEAGNLEVNTNIRYFGAGSTYTGGEGTVIKLADGANAHLFRPTDGWTVEGEYAHHVYFEKMTLDGNKANQVGAWDLIRLNKGGFNSKVEDVFFRDAGGVALRTFGWVNNLYLINTTGGANDGGLFRFESAPWMVGIIGGQFSGNGVSPIYIGPSGTAEVSQIFIQGVKIESGPAVGSNQYVVHYRPRDSGGHPISIHISNLSAAHSAGGGIAVAYEENKGGHGAHWVLNNIDTGGFDKYQYAFLSDKTGQHSIDRRLMHGVFQARKTTDPYWPHYEIDGIGIDAGLGSPEGKVSRPVGSQYSQRDGLPGSVFWVKESGDGNTGWVAK